MTLTTSDTHNPLAAMIDGRSKDWDSRLRFFVSWQDAVGESWLSPNLASYRDYLLHERELAASTISAHLSQIRAVYRRLLKDNDLRQQLFESTDSTLAAADRFAMVNEVVTRLENAIDPETAPVKVETIQDREDGAFLRLSPDQALDLLRAPGADTVKGLRDTALLAVLLCTGIREQEVCSLDVADLRQALGGELALRVRRGKGAKQRLVPYGGMAWCLGWIDAWLAELDITQGAVFRSLTKGGQVRVDADGKPKRLTRRSVHFILSEYPISIQGELRAIKPHDLRRTYARLQYDAQLPLLSIQRNLGHASQQTTLGYIGGLDGWQRRAKTVFRFDVSKAMRRSK